MLETLSLNEEKIREVLPRGEFSQVLIHTFATIDSTNTRAKNVAREYIEKGNGTGKYEVFVSERQTQGRGRLGRSFSSPLGGLYITFLVPCENRDFNPTELTTYTAVAISKAIDNTTKLSTKIKWVNDIYANGKKLSGILAEGVIDPEKGKVAYAVVGIGININKGVLPEELKEIATAIEDESGERVEINALSAEIIRQFLENLCKVGTVETAERYREKSFLIGEEINVIKPTQTYPAKVEGITDKCELILKLENGQREILSTGEVSVRLKK